MSMQLTGNQNNCSYNLKYLIWKYHARAFGEKNSENILKFYIPCALCIY